MGITNGGIGGTVIGAITISARAGITDDSSAGITQVRNFVSL
jgi:hypothetical protein